jgi:predicted extracellular nuclease
VKRTPIHAIQGSDLRSPLAGTEVRTRGVVTGTTRKGFFIQDPDGGEAGCSHAIFVFSPRRKPPVGALVEVQGQVTDFSLDEMERPTTQIHAVDTRTLDDEGPRLKPVWLTAERIALDNDALAAYLNSIEGMLVGIEAGATFVAPSNPFGDYVVVPAGTNATRTRHGGVLVDPHNPERWYPGFRIVDYSRAPQVNVGAELLSPVVGPLNYRVSSYQIAALGPIRVRPASIKLKRATLRPETTRATVLTLNGFNLDSRVEDPSLVQDPRRDIDDDDADGRYAMLAAAIARDAAAPDIVALQEMQDNDGAQITDVVDADENYKKLVRTIRAVGGPTYRWVDVPPQPGADGGQPGGNIRNAFLYNPERVAIAPGSVQLVGADDAAFEDSRKPLMVKFRMLSTNRELAVINVHLASKRHQRGGFAPERPGFDPRQETRVRQALLVRATLLNLAERGINYYVTGDFNDFEFSETLRAMLGDESINLVDRVPREERYDYNHRGKSQALMHGIVSKQHADERNIEYEILHGNELIGTKPGHLGDKATDHAYVIAGIEMH